MYSPSNLSSERHFELYVQLAEAARVDPELIPNHVEGRVPAWLNAYKDESTEILKLITGTGDDELQNRLETNMQRVLKVLEAYPNYVQ